MDFYKIKDAIESYSKEDFHIKMLRGVGLKKEFPSVCDDIEYATEEEKDAIREAFIKNDFPGELIEDDESLKTACKLLSSRSVQVR